MAWSRGSLLSAQWLACPWARLIHVILDNHVIDKPQSVRDLLQQMGGKTRLHFLLPYCSNENRIERLWQDMCVNVTRNHRCRTVKLLLANVLRWLETRFSDEEEYAFAV